MSFIKRILKIFNFKTFLITIFSIFSTLLCDKYNISADFPMTIISIAVVFPLVFSIGEAYKRRENALQHYSSMKTHGYSIYLAARDWSTEISTEQLNNVKIVLHSIFKSAHNFLGSDKIEQDVKENDVYKKFSDLSVQIKEFRNYGIASGEVSRCNQYLSKMLDAFENMKHIFQYRTPRSLRIYSNVFIFLISIVFGPSFVHIAGEFNTFILLLMPVLLSIVLSSLDNIQEELENPFDQIGQDDIQINEDKFIERLN